MQADGGVMERMLARRAQEVSSWTATAAPTGAPPPHALAAAVAALEQGQTHYTVGPGILPLREAIAARSTAEGFPATAESVVVTNGGSEALYIALQSALKAGERAAIAGPVAPNVPQMVEFIGAVPLTLSGDEGSRFMPSPEEVVASGASVLLLGSPSPATGMALTPGDLERMLEAALEREMTVVLDRTLAWCCFDPGKARFENADLASRVLTTGSFSDAYVMHGWRAGYFSAAPAHLATMRELKQSMSICTSTMSQYAALAALQGPETWLDQRRRAMAAERERVVAICAGAGIEPLASDAWPPLLLRPEPGVTAEEAARRLGMPVEPAERYGDALWGLLRARLGAGAVKEVGE